MKLLQLRGHVCARHDHSNDAAALGDDHSLQRAALDPIQDVQACGLELGGAYRIRRRPGCEPSLPDEIATRVA